jgi:hypothetical protein
VGNQELIDGRVVRLALAAVGLLKLFSGHVRAETGTRPSNGDVLRSKRQRSCLNKSIEPFDAW